MASLPSLIINGRSRVDGLAADLLPIDHLRGATGPAHLAVATPGCNLRVDTRRIQYNKGAWWRQSGGLCLNYHGARCHVAPNTGSIGALSAAVRFACRLRNEWPNNLLGGNAHGRKREPIEP